MKQDKQTSYFVFFRDIAKNSLLRWRLFIYWTFLGLFDAVVFFFGAYFLFDNATVTSNGQVRAEGILRQRNCSFQFPKDNNKCVYQYFKDFVEKSTSLLANPIYACILILAAIMFIHMCTTHLVLIKLRFFSFILHVQLLGQVSHILYPIICFLICEIYCVDLIIYFKIATVSQQTLFVLTLKIQRKRNQGTHRFNSQS